jgi:hypothetical protein
MTMKFLRVGSIGGLGALLLAAVGCSVETSLEEQEEELGQTTQAVCGDYDAYVAACQARCVGTGCTDGSAMASCMSSCMADFCVGPPQPPP